MSARDALRDRHAIVTGAGTGIGRAIAVRLGAEGLKLGLIGRREALLRETAERITSAGGSPPFVAVADIRDQSAVDAAFAAAAEANGPLHALIANSGIGGPNDAGPNDRFADLVATNINGTYHSLRAAERHLAPGPEPRHLVVIASILARIGVSGYTGYCASKAGLLGLVRALARELAPRGVQVNAVCPGWVDTEMSRQGIAAMADAMGMSWEDALGVAMQEVPLRRMSQPEEIAGTIAWLISADARGVTGQGIDINNGAFMI